MIQGRRHTTVRDDGSPLVVEFSAGQWQEEYADGLVFTWAEDGEGRYVSMTGPEDWRVRQEILDWRNR